MQGGVEVVDGARLGNQLFSGGFVGAPRICKRCGRGFDAVKIANARLIGDRDHHDVPSLFAVPDREDTHPRTSSGQRARIRVGLLCADQLSRSAHDASEKFLG